jgi:hypothetical protein
MPALRISDNLRALSCVVLVSTTLPAADVDVICANGAEDAAAPNAAIRNSQS